MNKILFVLCILIYCSIANASPMGTLDIPNVYNSKGEIYGWACNPASPSLVYEIRFYINNTYAGSTQANMQREAGVAGVCGGNVNHGFSWTIPENYFNGIQKSVDAKMYYQNNYIGQLAGAPLNLQMPSLSTHPRGYLDHIDKEYIFGWACDPNYTQINSEITVDFYSQDHGFLGSSVPNMRRENAVAGLCGGTNLRGFQFSIPEYLRNNKTHTIVAIARNRTGTMRRQIGNGVNKLYFSSAAYTNMASMPSVNSNNINTLLRTVYDPAPYSPGIFYLASYCYGSQAASQSLSWNVSQYTGFSVPQPVSSWQRGLANTIGHIALQGNGTTYGTYISYQPSHILPTCQDIAGTNVVAEWQSNQPSPWFTNIKKEIGISFEAKIPTATGVAYGGPGFLFYDPSRSRSFWLTVQMFDSRGLGNEVFIYNDCPGCPTSIPILATTIGRNNNYGRTPKGNFHGSNFSGFQSFDFRLNGYHIENALLELGCNESNTNYLSCNPKNYKIRIAAVGLETYQNSSIGSSIKNTRIFWAN